MLTTELGIVILFKLIQSQNANSPILVKEEGRFSIFKLEQARKE